MARFRLASAHVIDGRKLKIGSTIADTQGNAVAGDYVWSGLNAASLSYGLIPLDGAATTMLNASRFAGGPARISDGVNSIDG